MGAQPVFRLDAITHHFDPRAAALRGVSLEVRQGERVAIVGESGAGKSTLLRCFNLLVRPDAGSVRFDGRDLSALDDGALARERQRMGMIFQHFALLHRRTVRENVALPLELAGIPRAERARRVDDALERVELSEKADAWPSQLSGGQRQRVGIARALVHEPRVLLCDEPTSALDARTARNVVELLDRLSREQQLAVIVVTHQLEVVRSLAERVIVLDRGEVAEDQPVGSFFSAPQSQAGRQLLASRRGPSWPTYLLDEVRGNAGVGTITLLTIRVGEHIAPTEVLELLAFRFHLAVDLVTADIEPLQDHAVGEICIIAHGEPARIDSALSSLRAQHVDVEVIGHVRHAA